MTRFAPILGAGLLALVVAACGSATASQSSGPPASLAPGSPHIVARDIAFTTPAVTAAADKPFTIDFENQDSAPHNVAIEAAGGRNVFRGDVFGGASHRIYSVPALAAGTYTFKCDVHPDMKGTLTIS